ncbi:DNA replication licensing factor Mcm3 [Athalia rosae]|uniref:DNA replication licensing factor Mcm3 n=1 Tax=Athalia rosae TaxID=37344 RepID=UPI002033B8C7|nr:DNA replication licensing factor Mcm3 [Athalia rosae]
MADPLDDQRNQNIVQEYYDFLDDQDDQGTYMELVKDMIDEKKHRLIVNINHLRKKFPNRAASLLTNVFEEQAAFQNALKQYVATFDPVYSKSNTELFIAFEGSFGTKHVTPRTLTSRFLGNLICLEGIVTKCSSVRPKVVRSVHYCPATKTAIERTYTDLTSMDAFPTPSVYPTKDDDGNALETEFGLSTYKDHQTLSIQEMPEKAPAGQLPRSVDVICDNDLVDLCKPGDRVQVVGNYRCLPNKQAGFTSGSFRTILIANNISQINKDADLEISRDDVAMCKKIAKKSSVSDIFNLLSKSLAPSIHGHKYVKRAILCLLLGGVEKILPNGTRLRGDINILLIGDPSVAKSQLLRYVLCTAPRAIPTTGRGSSGVGLTAAVTTDQETGERRLEAGAMVLADRGVVCIDEFDKMSDMDRTAIHEVMEQGRVTIAKAGIHASLNARCSVLAAANPVYGRYNQYKSPMENIGLQDSLLSRFDLLFVMLDTIDSSHDQMISDHVVRIHMYRSANEKDGQAVNMRSNVDMLTTQNPDVVDDEEAETLIYEKYDPLLHGSSRAKSDQILSAKFMRKYIHIAKCMKPKLTEQASEVIADEYSRLRSEDAVKSDVARTQPITARALETLIRISTAHAKARLSRTVDVDDAYAAIELVQFAYFKRVIEKEKKRRRHASENSDQSADEDGKSRKRIRKTKKQPGDEGYDQYEFDSDDDSHVDEAIRRTTRSQVPAVATAASRTTMTSHAEPMSVEEEDATIIDEDRLKIFRSSLLQLFREERNQPVSLSRVHEYVNSQTSPDFTKGEVSAAVSKMTDANQIMLADGIVFLI